MSDEPIDRRFDLRTREADVPQGAVIELAQACNGGATDEIARNPVAMGANQPRKCTASVRDRRPSNG